MNRRRVLSAFLAIWMTWVARPGQSGAQPPDLTPDEQSALDTCLEIIRGCQLPDGAMTQTNLGNLPESPVWIPPYFANYAMLALIANHERDPEAGDLVRVRLWLDWCCAHQEPEGFWYDYTGTRAAYSSSGTVDAWDSSAAMYLVVLGRYEAAGGSVTPEMQTAALRSLDCLKGLTDPVDGLTLGRPDYPVKFLMDNIEVYAGLVAGASYFQAVGLHEASSFAAGQATFIKASLANYWKEDQGLYAWAQHPNGQQDVGSSDLYPHGLAQLFGVAFVSPHLAAWQAANAFEPEHTPYGTGTEWFTIAASRIGGQDELDWRAALVEDVESFTPTNVYVFRPGLAALALLEGADWFPGPAIPETPSAPTSDEPAVVLGVADELLFQKFSPSQLASGPTPRLVTMAQNSAPPPSGLVFQVDPEGVQRGSLALGGLPQEAGIQTCTLAYFEGQATIERPLHLVIFIDADHRDTYEYYVGLRDMATGVDYSYWQALAGYVLGMGTGDEGLALYNYYTSLGDYFYVVYVESSPSEARYYYYYYRGLGAYYYHEKRGDIATANAMYTYYMGLALAAW